MVYSNLLPRKIPATTMICQYLYSNGKRCMNKAKHEVTYHGDAEVMGGWVTTCLCEKHYKDWCDLDMRDWGK